MRSKPCLTLSAVSPKAVPSTRPKVRSRRRARRYTSSLEETLSRGLATEGTRRHDMAPATGSYVYGVVFADDAAAKETRAVDDDPGVKLVRHEGIAALTSDVDVTRPLGTPDDLIAHERVLDAAAARGPVLPMRFGSVMTSGDAVKDELLADHYDELVTALEDLKGRAEFVVRGRYVQDVVLTEVLSENTEAARPSPGSRGIDSHLTIG